MSKTHTPGPWKVIRNNRNCTINVVSAPDADGESVKIALVNFQDEANANLIAAAPDLLAERDALREALKPFAEIADIYEIDALSVGDLETFIDVEDLRRARAALKGE